jgi:chromosome partitioning protein
MRTIALISGKGGSGKSTIAAHLAVAAAKTGSVAALDLDPQASLLEWGQLRAEQDVTVAAARVTDLARLLRKAAQQRAAWAILDTAGRQDSVAAQVATMVDVCLCPVRQSSYDLRATRATAAMLRAARAKCTFYVLNGCSSVGTRASEARRFLMQFGQVCPVQLGSRIDFSDALADGRTVFELNPKGKAAAEILALFQWIQALPINHQSTKPRNS